MIPKELQERKQWICWKYEEKPGRAKPTKVPYNPISGYRASTTDSTTWTDYETAKKAMGNFSGIGFVFSKDDPYIGIDLDHVLDKDKKFTYKDAEDLYNYCQSYTEISPSGTGIHILGKATLSPNAPHKVEENKEDGRCEKEMYDQGRFFTVTGNQLGECSEVNDMQMMAEAMEQMIDSDRKIASKHKNTQVMATSKGQVIDSENIKPDPIIAYTQQIFPELHEGKAGQEYQDALHQKAAEVLEFIEKTDITKVKKGRDLFITYQQDGREKTAIIPDQGAGFSIPADPAGQKKYLFTKLIRNAEQEKQWHVYKQPRLEDMHKITQVLVAKMSQTPAEATRQEYFDFQDLKKAVNKPVKDLWEELVADMGRAPQLCHSITLCTTPNARGVLVSNSITGVLSKDASLKLENIQEIPSNTQEVKAENFRPVLENAMVMSEQKANYLWLQQHGVSCYVMESKDMSDKVFKNCSISNFHVNYPMKNTAFEECAFDSLSAESGVALKNVTLTKCRIGSAKDLLALQQMGAEIKDCQVYQMDKTVGKMRWQLIGLEKPKLVETPGIARKTDKEGLER